MDKLQTTVRPRNAVSLSDNVPSRSISKDSRCQENVMTYGGIVTPKRTRKRAFWYARKNGRTVVESKFPSLREQTEEALKAKQTAIRPEEPLFVDHY